jgi:chromosome segregation ATPase
MADDMANGEETRHYIDPQSAAMGERISNLNRRQTDYEAESRANFRAIEASIGAITAEMRQSFSSITSTLAERNKPQWQALSVMLVFVGMVGALAYMPIREATDDLKTNVSTLAAETRRSFEMAGERFISRQEMDWRSARGAEDRIRTEGAIADLRAGSVTRNEWMERNASRDHDIANIRSDIEREVANLQRQIDQQRGDFQTFSNSLGNGRDVIQDMKEEIGRLREQLADMRARQWQSLRSTVPPS